MNRMELAGRILSLGSENKGCNKIKKGEVLQEAMRLIRDYEKGMLFNWIMGILWKKTNKN